MVSEIDTVTECNISHDAYFIGPEEEVGELQNRWKVRREVCSHDLLPICPLPKKEDQRKFWKLEPMDTTVGGSGGVKKDKDGELTFQGEVYTKIITDDGASFKLSAGGSASPTGSSSPSSTGEKPSSSNAEFEIKLDFEKKF